MLLLFAAACHHHPPVAPHPPASYDVTAVLASEGHLLTSEYRVAVTRGSHRSLVFQTLQSRVIIEDSQGQFTWDSSSPDPAEPWVVKQERQVSSVPTRVVLDSSGRPVAMSDEDAWRQEVTRALEAIGLPEEARASAGALTDPAGVLAGLARDFPGAPPAVGPWVRVEFIGPREIVRTEVCSEAGIGRVVCEGTTSGDALEAGSSKTELSWDGDGLLALDTRWDAVAVATAPGGASRQRVVAGRRRIVRVAP